MNVQSCLSTIDTEQDVEAFTTLNMNVGVNFEPVGKKLFNTNPFAVAFKRSAARGFVALARHQPAAARDAGRHGAADHQSAGQRPADPGNIIRIELKDPAEIRRGRSARHRSAGRTRAASC